jgi:hypothetical protein
MYAAVKERAEAEDRSLVSFVRRAIASYLGWPDPTVRISPERDRA